MVLDGNVEGSSAQPYDLDLAAVAGLPLLALLPELLVVIWQTRTVAGAAGRIAITNGNGVSGNPTVDLISTTAVTAAEYNTLTSVSALGSAFGTQTVNAVKFTVDAVWSFNKCNKCAIATATEVVSMLTMMQGLLMSDMTSSRMHRRFTKHMRQLVLVLVLLLISAVIMEVGATSRAEATEQKGLKLLCTGRFRR